MAALIDIQRQHTLGTEQARSVIERIGESLKEKFGVVPTWQEDTLHFARSGVDGSIAVSGETVHVNVRLGMLLAPMKSTVEAEILRKLDKYFPL